MTSGLIRIGARRRPRTYRAIAAEPARRLRRLGLAGLAAALVAVGHAGGAHAKCLPIAGLERGFILAALPEAGTVRLTYLGHSSFLIETPEGTTAVTDYNGAVRPAEMPDIVTMNNAHPSHFTDFVDPEIEIVLRGWDPGGGAANHDITHESLKIWNIPTNIRGFGGIRLNGNSIFVFEAEGLCIAHLGHLHHTLTDADLGALGLIDVLLVPVDGSVTMSQELMVDVIAQISPSVVIPMHYFGQYSLARFLGLISDRYETIVAESSTIVLSRLNLPYRKVVVMPPGQYYSSPSFD
jgi:L-ascorbate metabolism protein UlaG (beta-lactamase superfamily)